ncbi:hypothetical protein RHMOL_Rhmol03G0209900 [Rhododendron molle]|uniref:Uncharacterized protein n=1 Tax=Rhododendron molle TaxID=49168 RepID=A0ACC0PI22_RHOML|nr:hypothetical protein RHMOL_Rhmol03G0209900 [Rhododendron molle]
MDTSVFQKAKAKARKVKDTIKTKTGHGPDIDDTNQNDQGHEDEQMVEDSEVDDTVPILLSYHTYNIKYGLKSELFLTVGEEPGIGSTLNSFNKLNVDDGKPESKPISKRGPETYTESQDHFSQEPIPPTSTVNPDDPGSIPKSFDSDKPEDAPLDNVTNLPPNQSSYTGKISYATSAVAGTAIAAKNVVASKLGYGGTKDPTASPKATQGGEEIGKPGTTTVYEKVFNAGSSVVTPVYGKVSNVGSSVVSKVRGTGTKQDQGVEGQDREVKGQDQGVPVKKGYLAEKLRPSDDDKLLSEVISDALHNRKQEVDGEEEGENQKPAVGIVTESEEVRERLGSDEGNRGVTETESKAAPNVSPTGKGMVESVKGTVTSWFSKGGDQKQNSEASPGTIPEEERLSSSTGEEAVGHGQSGVGERRLQESGN